MCELAMYWGRGVEWENREFEDENSFNFTKLPIMRQSSLFGKALYVPFYVKNIIADFLIDAYDKTGPYDAIVELGCGYGRNLFDIFYRGGPIDVAYYGGEFTQSGVQIATELAAATPNMNIKFFHFNHLNPEISFLTSEIKRAFVFTCHTIEQVTMIPDNWFEVVASIASHVRCIHLEPFGFQVRTLGETTKLQKEMFNENQWNLNFIDALKSAVSKGTIVLDDTILENSLSDDPINSTSIAVWHSNLNTK
ncbi:hypothetical protein KDE13_02080 [Campylobacter sp. faydin G-140]|uniref:class I SAM-dependent methyltransferase n=1 Tax=Campylobacter anatolicus TaxID=2829105 RepID=UPI001B950837|nr:class I SAM-dependent methyltransferase [Campylobacter anatolicus]MBR8465152.1 hypothetical protein [Campylobacter anatolicus]